jgi:hypothetical protein
MVTVVVIKVISGDETIHIHRAGRGHKCYGLKNDHSNCSWLIIKSDKVNDHVWGQNQNINMAMSFENVAEFKYLGTTLTNQNDIHDEIKSRLNSGNACYYSVQNILSSRLISKNKD